MDQVDYVKLQALLNRPNKQSAYNAWYHLQKKLGIATNSKKGSRTSTKRKTANDENEDADTATAEQAEEEEDDDASDDEVQEDPKPIKKTNSRGQTTAKTILEEKGQAACKRPDGRKAKSPVKKKAPRKKAKDRVPRKTNLEKYVWIPPKSEEGGDGGMEIDGEANGHDTDHHGTGEGAESQNSVPKASENPGSRDVTARTMVTTLTTAVLEKAPSLGSAPERPQRGPKESWY